MHGHDNEQHGSVESELFLEDLLPAMATCAGADPGPDPTWDEDPYPDDAPSIAP